MDRRSVLRFLTAAGAGLFGMGHSPYRQWYVYRRLRLFILTNAAEPASHALGETVATLLATHLPESRALATRARDSVEIVKLLGSEQLDLALLTRDDAREALAGAGAFAEDGAVPLRALAELGAYLFVCRDDFPSDKAYRIAKTLAEHRDDLALAGSGAADVISRPVSPIPFHPGALEYQQSRAATQ